jgi:hypothetical protein
MNGIPRTALRIQMFAFALMYPILSNLSERNPPSKHDARPKPATMNAFAILY